MNMSTRAIRRKYGGDAWIQEKIRPGYMILNRKEWLLIGTEHYCIQLYSVIPLLAILEMPRTPMEHSADTSNSGQTIAVVSTHANQPAVDKSTVGVGSQVDV